MYKKFQHWETRSKGAILQTSWAKLTLASKLVLTSIILTSCVGGFLSLLLSGPGGLPLVAAFIVPGARQLVATSSHPLVRFFSEPQIVAVTYRDCDISPKAYVTNLRSDSVSVIDVVEDKVIATIPVGRNPFAIAITPDCSKAYVGNSGNLFIPENTVSVIDINTDTLIDTDPNAPGINPITVGLNPGAMAITPDGSKLYVANFGTENVPDNTVSVIDVEKDSVVDVNPDTSEVDPIVVGLRPGALIIAADGARAYVTNSFDSTISVIDVQEDRVIDTVINSIEVEGQLDFQFNPAGIAITDSKAYVANADSDTVSVIDLSSNEVVAALNVGTKPLVLAVTPDGSKVLVTNLLSNNVSVIDVQKSVEDPDNAVIATISVGIIPIGIGVIPNGSKAYVGNCNCGVADPDEPDTVSVIDVANNKLIDVNPATPEIDSIPVGLGPLGLAITEDGSKVYVPNSNSSTVSVINVEEDVVTTTIPVGSGPADAVISPDDSRVYVSNFNNPDSPGNTVSVIDAAANAVIDEITVGLGPTGLAISPDGSTLYVSNFGSIREPGNTVSVVDLNKNEVIKTIPVGVGPIAVAIDPDGSRAYVTNFGDKNSLGTTVSVIDVEASEAIGTVTVGQGPAGIAVKPNPDASKVYVANLGGLGDPGNTVSVIDVITGTVGIIPVGLGPIDVAITPDGSNAYVTNFGGITSQTNFEAGNSVSVLDLMGDFLSEEVTIGPGLEGIGPAGIAITPGDGSGIYVSNFDIVDNESAPTSISNPGMRVSLINRSDNDVVKTILVGNRPLGIASTHDGSKVYVANYFGNAVSVIDTSTNTVILTIPIM